MINRLLHYKNQIVSTLEQLLSIATYDHEQHKANNAMLSEILQKTRDLTTLLVEERANSVSLRTELRDCRAELNVLSERLSVAALQSLLDNDSLLLSAQNQMLREQVALQNKITDLGGFIRDRIYSPLSSMHGEFSSIHVQLRESKNSIIALQGRQEKVIGSIELLAKSSQPVNIMKECELAHAEISLMVALRPFLSETIAFDIGAHTGDVSQKLLGAGYKLFSFEPHIPSFNILQKRFSDNKEIFCFNYALGETEQTRELEVLAALEPQLQTTVDPTLFNNLTHRPVPEGMFTATTVDVRTNTIDSLVSSQTIPSKIGLIKIDTEGMDLSILKGSQLLDFEVAVCEYWDPKLFLWTPEIYKLTELVALMRARGYLWHIVFATKHGDMETVFYTDCTDTIPDTWGNVFFFKNFDLFAKAVFWSQGKLRQARFEPIWS